MAVELAVMVPVAIVVGLIVFNLARFCEACVAFDRIAADAVISQGVSPAGDAGVVAVDEVSSVIESALDMRSCEVAVTAEQLTGQARSGLGIGFPVSPLLTRFTCTLSYRPWPSSFVMAGVAFTPPVVLTHTRVLVVDRYRGGVVI
jgi:hypothetical protein